METIDEIVADMRYGMIPKHRHDRELLLNYADRINEAAVVRENRTCQDSLQVQSVTKCNQHETVDIESRCIYGEVTEHGETVADVIDAFECDVNNGLVLKICNKPYFCEIVARLRRAHGKEVEQYAKANRYDVCNMAKAREALENIRRDLWDLMGSVSESLRESLACKIRATIRATLSAPARNCDLYKSEPEAYQAYLTAIKNATKKTYVYFEPWLFAEAKGATYEQ